MSEGETKYRIEICQMGAVIKVFETDSFLKAKEIYRSYTGKIGCSTELYIDDRRLKYGKAFELMLDEWYFLDFRSEQTRRTEAKGERHWQ